jgi:hypothetical protein
MLKVYEQDRRFLHNIIHKRVEIAQTSSPAVPELASKATGAAIANGMTTGALHEC